MDAQYKIIGGDGREYGPATLEELKSWIRDGRVAGTTQVWRSDLASWAPASQYPELAGEFQQGVVARPMGTSVAADLKPVGFWARLAAYIIDALIISFVFTFVWSAVAAMAHWQLPQPPTWNLADPEGTAQAFAAYVEQLSPFLVPLLLIKGFIYMVYDVSLNGRFGATLGKMAIGARIVRLNGSPIGFKLAFLRWLAARVSDFLCYIGYLFIAFRADKRALHDLMVGTKVIYKR